jgi:hypothetical protein
VCGATRIEVCDATCIEVCDATCIEVCGATCIEVCDATRIEEMKTVSGILVVQQERRRWYFRSNWSSVNLLVPVLTGSMLFTTQIPHGLL